MNTEIPDDFGNFTSVLSENLDLYSIAIHLVSQKHLPNYAIFYKKQPTEEVLSTLILYKSRMAIKKES